MNYNHFTPPSPKINLFLHFLQFFYFEYQQRCFRHTKSPFLQCWKKGKTLISAADATGLAFYRTERRNQPSSAKYLMVRTIWLV